MVLAMYEIWKALSSHHSLLQGGHGWWWEMEHVGSKGKSNYSKHYITVSNTDQKGVRYNKQAFSVQQGNVMPPETVMVYG